MITFVFLSSEGIESTCKLCEEVLCSVKYYICRPFSTASNYLLGLGQKSSLLASWEFWVQIKVISQST